MILPFPLATSGEIAAVLRPGGGLRSDSALRTLRENGLTAPQLSMVPRAAGAAHGRLVWYSSLTLDVARLHRRRNADAAQAALAGAAELMSHRSARHLVEALTSCGPEPVAAELDSLTGGALTRLAVLTESRRNQLGPILHLRRSSGIVVARAGELAVVETDDGLRLGVPAPPVDQAQLGAIGSYVAIDAEQLDDRSSFVWVRPAFEPPSDRHSRVPGPPHLLSEEERRRIERDILVVG